MRRDQALDAIDLKTATKFTGYRLRASSKTHFCRLDLTFNALLTVLIKTSMSRLNPQRTNPVPSSEEPDESHSSFPSDPSEFDSDPRISFSKLDDKFILETEDGQEFEFDSALKRWIPSVRIRPQLVQDRTRCS
jgi:hypothetical protein